MFYLLILALGLQTPAPVRVYVWTAKPAIVDLDQKDREDSVADVIKGLDKKVLVAVPQETSEIQIEVTKRSAVPTGGMNPANPKLYQFSETPVLERTVFATLRFGDYSLDLVCGAGNGTAGWRVAAWVCADKAKKWVTANLKQIRPK